MSEYYQRRFGFSQASQATTRFVVGQRVRIMHAPESYGYNGRAGVIVAISGKQISVLVDEQPADMRCTTFYAEELEPEAVS